MINTTNTDSNKKISNYGLLLINNCVLAAMLACPFVPAFTRYFTNPYLCIAVILVLSFLNYHLTKIIRNARFDNGTALVNDYGGKLKIKVFVWSILVATVMLIGAGPILDPAAYSVDKFTRIFGVGMINDYSAQKKIHFFYFACIIYCLLVLNVCQSIRCALINNLHNPIRRLSTFSDTMIFVGFSFLLVCVYRQFSSHYQYDLTLCLLKSFLIFLIPAFYIWQSGKLNIGDVRVLLALAMFSLILSMDLSVYFDVRKLKFSDVLAIVLFVSASVFFVNKFLGIFDCKVFCSKIIILSLIGGFSLVFFSISFEISNLLALKTDKFINIEKIFHTVFCVLLCLSVACLFAVRKTLSWRTASKALFAFVLGVALIQSQPSLVIRSDLTIYEGASYSIPISDFLKYGKIPIFENFPAHMLYRVISSIAYGAITSDYRGALFAPWSNWLYGAAILLTFYLFVKILTNAFTAVSMVILLPYLTLTGSITAFGIGLSVLLPFFAYITTLKRRYLILTVCLAYFMVAFKLDIGFSFLAGILCSSLCVSLLYSNKLAYRVFSSFVFGGLVILCMFLLTCLIKDINPLLRVQQYLSIASSNDNWGFATLGNTEKNSYSIFYFVLPFISVICFIIAISCRSRFSMFQSAVLLCLLFAYYANIPRFLMRHSLAEYHRYVLIICLWTLPLAVSYLISVLYSKKSLFILCQTAIILVAYMVFQGETFYENSPLQAAVGRAVSLSGQIRSDIRKKDIMTVSRGGSRVVYDESKSEHLAYASQIKQVTDLLLSRDETFIDFTNQNAAYAWSGRKNPTYVTVLALLSGETAQKAFIRELEDNLNNVPIVIMPTDKGWYHTLQLDGINNNIRYYLVAEWIYRNYRPLVKFNDFSSVWVLNSRYTDFYHKLSEQRLLTSSKIYLKTTEFPNSANLTLKPVCHNCSVQITSEGLEIKPNGDAPYLMDFDKLIGVNSLKSYTWLTLDLTRPNDGDYQLFITSDKAKGNADKYSVYSSNLSHVVKSFDLRTFNKTVGNLNRLRLDVPDNGITLIKRVSISMLDLALIDWGYDNFVGMPNGAVPQPKFISKAHEYNMQLLPFLWGQLDSKKAADGADLVPVTFKKEGDLYSWNYSGKEGKPVYLRIDMSVKHDFLKKTQSSYLHLGNIENGKFLSLNRFKFKLKEGENVYLFRISSDYYWSRGMLTSLSLDPRLRNSVTSVRLLVGD